MLAATRLLRWPMVGAALGAGRRVRKAMVLTVALLGQRGITAALVVVAAVVARPEQTPPARQVAMAAITGIVPVREPAARRQEARMVERAR